MGNVMDGKFMDERSTRTDFERCYQKLFNKTTHSIDVLLLGTKLNQEQKYKVIPLGGLPRIPRIRQLVADCFGEDRITYSTHRDQAAMEGTARYVSHLAEVQDGQVPEHALKTSVQ
ncbi:hypothetical protein D915_003225 [Fasciola hepatica]|uniref:Uncharacterized protein n=1 Tax=Fasciola hepatica TaxID=6192 RepID=A0A4E0S2J6_FASHE|nr:hypothetical protein D915_003225 [Fasciola hepatica]